MSNEANIDTVNNLIVELNALTSVSTKFLKKLLEATIYSITSAVEEAHLENKTIVDVDIGIGTLVIGFDNDEVKYKIIPSAKLNVAVVDALQDKMTTLELKLEQSLIEKAQNTYKDLL